MSETLTPEALGLREYRAEDTYIDLPGRAWIGVRWDLCELPSGGVAIYRKGNWVLNVGSMDLALAIVQDNEGFPLGGLDREANDSGTPLKDGGS